MICRKRSVFVLLGREGLYPTASRDVEGKEWGEPGTESAMTNWRSYRKTGNESGGVQRATYLNDACFKHFALSVCLIRAHVPRLFSEPVQNLMAIT